jgi:hypothetical protein
MRRILFLTIIVSVIFGYMLSEETVKRVPHGPEIRIIIQDIGDPIRDTAQEMFARQLPRITDFMLATMQNVVSHAFDSIRTNTQEGLHVKEGFQNNLDEEQKKEINKEVDKDVERLLGQ